MSEQYNHPFGHLFGKKVYLNANAEKIIYHAEEKDKVMLREFAQWSYLLNQVYNSYDRKGLEQNHNTEQQWPEWYEKITYESFAVLKFFYQDRYEKYHELSEIYGIGKDNIAMMERLLKEEAENILIKGEDGEHTES